MKAKKILSSLVALVLALGTINMPAYAETSVAEVGDVKYADIQEAIKAAAPDGTVDIINDVVVDEWVMFAESLSIGNGDLITLIIDGLTINGNEHSLTVNSIESANNGARLFYDAQNLNINNLTIEYANGVSGGIGLKSGVIDNVTFNGGVYGVLPQDGDITINDCTFATNGTAIYFEDARDNLKVTNNTFNQPDGVNVILLRGNTTFTGNTINSGRTVNVVSGSPVVTGNDFNDVRFKVYNDATAKIESNLINNIEIGNPEAEVKSTFTGNTLSEAAEEILKDAGVIEEHAPVVAKIGDQGYATLKEAFAAAGAGDVVIELLADAELSYEAREAYGKDDTTSITINGNNNTLTLNQTDSDWSSIGMANADGVFKMNNVNVVKTGYGVPGGAWNTHAINFNVNTELTNVDFDNSIKVSGTSVLTNVNIVEDEEFYGIWIPADAESVTINGGSITATNGGRGIKIADEYVNAPAEVQLTVDGMTFETAKKAAVLVSSTAGADITATNCDITKVAADSTNFVWVDEDWSSSADKVIVNGGSIFVEGAIVINNIDELKSFRDDVNAGNTYEGKYVMLANDIDLTGENWTPIGNDNNYFWGTFDGGNNAISNMTININTPDSNVFAGLFGGIKKATVKNLTMTNVDIDAVGAKVRAAAVVGIAHSNSENRTDATINFENITVDGCGIEATATTGSALTGGVVGYSYPANMKNITVSDLTINGKSEAATGEVRAAAINGYVCGQNISNNGNTRAPMLVDTFEVSNATINAEGYTVFAGGYAPYTYYGYITLKNGNIDGLKITADAYEAFVGGLVGYFWRSDNGHTVENVDITGIDFDVTTDYLGETRIGGVVGTSQSPNTKYTDVSVSGKIVERCSDSANPVNYHAKVGGFVARTYEYAQQTYTNCVADVDVTGTNVVGGFVGNHNSTVSYVNCEAKGDVTGDIAGGFAGRLTEHGYTTDVTFDGCKASGTVTGTNVAGGFIGSTANHGWAAWSAGNGTAYGKNITLKDCVAAENVITINNTGYCAGVVGEAKVADSKELTLDNIIYSVEPAFYPAVTNVTVKTKVAQVGDVKYESLADAFAVGGDVILLADVELANTITVDSNVSLDLNGHKITSDVSTITVDGGELTIKDSTNSSGKVVTTAESHDYEAIAVKNGGELTLESGNIESGTHGIYAYTSGGIINVTGGKITLSGNDKDAMAIAVGSAAGSANISGGIIEANGVNWPMYAWNGSISITGGSFDFFPNAEYVAELHSVKEITVEEETWYQVAYSEKIAFIGETSYYTINDAVKAANAGDTITVNSCIITGDVTVNKDVTVQAADGATVKINGKLIITADGATVKGLTVVSSGTALYINAKDVLVEACEITGSNGLYQSYTDGTVTFKDSTITGSTYGIHFDGIAGGKIVIDNCEITGWTSFAASIEKVTISGSEFKNGNYNVLRFYQDAEVTDTIFPAEMTIDSGNGGTGMEGIDLKFDGCSIADGSSLEECFHEGVIDLSDVYVNGVLLGQDLSKPIGRPAFIRNIETKNTAGEDRYQVILFSGIDSLDYKNVGFKITVDGKTRTETTNVVYTGYTAAGVRHTPNEFGPNCNYIFALPVNFKTELGNSSLTYTPFATTKTGEVIWSTEKVIDKIYNK